MNARKPSFEEFTDLYYRPVYWHIRRSVVDHGNAEDILQETFIKAYRHWWQLRDPSAARAWIYRIATNEVNRWIRKNYRSAESPELTEDLTAALESGGFVDMAKAEAVALQKGMLRLSPLQKTVFSLRYFDDLDYDEISRITGSNVNTLKSSYNQAKNIIKQYVGQ